MIINWRLVQELAEKGMEIDKVLLDLAREWQEVTEWAAGIGFDEDHCKETYTAVMSQPRLRDLREVFVEMRRQMANKLPS